MNTNTFTIINFIKNDKYDTDFSGNVYVLTNKKQRVIQNNVLLFVNFDMFLILFDKNF